MNLLCRISLTPDTCVNQTQTRFEQLGLEAAAGGEVHSRTALVAPPLAGATRMGVIRFPTYSALGGRAVGRRRAAGRRAAAGADRAAAAAHRRTRRQRGCTAVVLLAAYVALSGGSALASIARSTWHASLSPSSRALHGQPRPGDARRALCDRSEAADVSAFPGRCTCRSTTSPGSGALPHDREIILYCSCPNEASAAQGGTRAHGVTASGRFVPFIGGLDAWIAAGYAVEEISAPESGATSPAHAPALPASRPS